MAHTSNDNGRDDLFPIKWKAAEPLSSLVEFTLRAASTRPLEIKLQRKPFHVILTNHSADV
jgi:hypothetical protein